jgi:hypothetical protein
MAMRSLVPFLFCFLVAMGKAYGQEQPYKDPWTSHPFMIEGHLTPSGSPYGHAAVALDWSPISWFSLNAGVGAGGAGPQYGFGGRFRLVASRIRSQSFAFTLGSGLSSGTYKNSFLDEINNGFEEDAPSASTRAATSPVRYMDNSTSSDRKWNPAYWYNLDLGVELRTADGFSLRLYMGAGRVLNNSICYDTTYPERKEIVVPCTSGTRKKVGYPYVGLALGYAF